MKVSVIGIDLGKNSCSLAGMDETGRLVFRKRASRSGLVETVGKHPGCMVAMEACCGAHHLGRVFAELGHEVRLMSPEYVQPYVKAQKNDDRDAEAIAEAATRPTMRFVPVKTQAQSDLQSLHRARERLVGDRTALINHLRALLLERGVIVAKGRAKLARELSDVLSNPAPELSSRILLLIEDLVDDWNRLDARIAAFDKEIVAVARADEAMRRLTSIPGIGPINATALVAAIGDASAFTKGRDLSAWLGLVPKQATTGGKPRLLGITKRGNRYLRKNLVHGARAVLPRLAAQDTRIGDWLRGMLARNHKNVVVVALANKLARICWAVLTGQQAFTHEAKPAH
ncbi:IS110 family RNA-guided transposase [Mangrovicoccus ximenensis]|uniref:IS110 family transposase n=1 Tax=Mangrovicoccus ximenensis TaxID=1911570 RepID=UPI000D36B65E|nr:IS110 family transposase [Mangrovicoccus ximenensis]